MKALAAGNPEIKEKMELDVDVTKENGFSADKIKNYLGICDKSNVYKWFRGDALPSVDNLLALSILFGVTINEMIIVENTEKAA